MTTMIYRGVTHDGARNVKPRVAQDLIYRGVRHDGLSTQMERAGSPVPMTYRGVHYVVAPRGAQSGTAHIAGAGGQFSGTLPGMAFIVAHAAETFREAIEAKLEQEIRPHALASHDAADRVFSGEEYQISTAENRN